MAKICRLPKDSITTVFNANIGNISDTLHSQVPSHPMQLKRLLKLKAPDCKKWAFTVRNCITDRENGSRSIGAGVYHPRFNKIITVEPGGTSINENINRAELAGIAATLISEHTHIATDSAGALWQIKNSILYPQRIKRHKHAKLLETIIIHHIQSSKDTIHLYKVKAHADILGIECADALAKCSAENQSGHDIPINADAHPHSSILWPARVENPPPACLPDTLNTCQPGHPADRFSIF